MVQVIAESRARLGNGGRLVIRESGTEPVIRVMAESDDEGLVDAVVNDIADRHPAGRLSSTILWPISADSGRLQRPGSITVTVQPVGLSLRLSEL